MEVDGFIPSEILFTIAHCTSQRHHPQQHIVFGKVSDFWSNLFETPATINSLARLLPGISSYLPKNDLLRLRILCKAISDALSTLIDETLTNCNLDGTVSENSSLRRRVIPTVIVPGRVMDDFEQFREWQRRFFGMDKRRRLSKFLCSSLEVKLDIKTDPTRNAIVTDFLPDVWAWITDLRLVVDGSTAEDLKNFYQFLLCKWDSNVRRLEIVVKLYADHRNHIITQERVGRLAQGVAAGNTLSLKLPLLNKLLLETNYVGPTSTRPLLSNLLGRYFGNMFHAQFSNIRGLLIHDFHGVRWCRANYFPRLTDLDIFPRTFVHEEVGRVNRLPLSRLTIRLWPMQIERPRNLPDCPPLLPEELVKLLSAGRGGRLKNTLKFLRIEINENKCLNREWDFTRHGLFPKCQGVAFDFPRLETLEIVNGYLAEDFGVLVELPRLKVIRCEFDDIPPLKNVIGLEESESIVWEHISSLETFTVKEKGGAEKWVFRSREKWDSPYREGLEYMIL